MLIDNYMDEDKIDKLISLGDISSLRERVEPNADEKHDFDNALEDVTIFYGRDRGETGVDCQTYWDAQGYISRGGEEYNYLYKDNDWYFAKPEIEYDGDDFTMTVKWELVRDWIGKGVY